MKQALCSLCVALVLMLFCGALSSTLAQTPSSTPDPFVIQLTSSGTTFRSNAGDISANGRFVVFESNGDVATEKTSTRNNLDGNREIFLADYAQRRVFQITDTKNVPKPAPSPTPTPSPAPSPTPTPSPTPADPSQIQIEISNNRPMISLAPELNSSNRRVYVIVFSSNAPTPGSFNGVDPGSLATDGNQELWIYEVPEVADVDLTSGADQALVNLAGGTFTQITDTPATRPPTPGAAGVAPFVADDNREASISDNGEIIAFISTGNLVTGVGNTDRNPELFFCDRTDPAARVFTQATNTQDSFVGPKLISVFQQNPSLSADGSVVVFLSSGNLNGNTNADGNGEVYVGSFSAGAFSIVRQATRTQLPASNATVNVLSFGRRVSRDGLLLALESLATDPKANSTTNESFLGTFVYNIASDTFTLVGQRAASGLGDIGRFPTFTDYNPVSLAPSTLVFASALNFKPDGTFPPADQDSTGLNPSPSGQIRPAQIFSTQVPVTSTNTFTRLTKNPVLGTGDLFSGIRPLPSASRERIAYSFGGVELGTGNADRSFELFYLLSPLVAAESEAVLSFSTGASDVALPAVAPSPAPNPSPGSISGLAAGELGVIRSTVEFVSSDAGPATGSETTRRPALPTELNGVSVSVNGAAAGLYFVGQTSKQINFVVPPAVATGVATVVVHSRVGGGTRQRGFLLISPAQPDIFSTVFGPDGRAVVCNVTNPLVMGCLGEPFSVTSPDETGTSVPTILQVNLTGVRSAINSEVKVTIGTIEITGDAIILVRSNPEMPGFDEIRFRVPDTLAGATDVPIIVTITRTGVPFVSRPADTAPLITFSP